MTTLPNLSDKPSSLADAAYLLKVQSIHTLHLAKTQEQEKLNAGAKWVQLDSRTRVLRLPQL